ncbi:MAG: PHP domain-containing protein [Candidatus Solibacter usitatus]|nr:PHP domain-containing protein [Candidatus Solibacter usitatus]
MIDLHTHTDESDGTYRPAELVDEAVATGLEALAISDHDTLAGYDAAEPLARAAGLDLICGIELSTKFHGRTVHLLGYFLNGGPSAEFRGWLKELHDSRRDRNIRLIARLQAQGVDVTLEEVSTGRGSQTGRPHFARVLIDKGYASSIEHAFQQYLGEESGSAYVQRMEPELGEALKLVAAGGGLASLAHPIRLVRRGASDGLDPMIAEMRELGLPAIEAFHSDHGPAEVAQYLGYAERYGLAVTGGSDFHGANKPRIRLGTGLDGNLDIPRAVLDKLRDK